MTEFTMKKDSKYIVYGAGGNCYHVMDTLGKVGCSVCAVIDKRAKELGDVRGVPAVLPEEITCEDPQNTIVIITVKNVFVHTEIALGLLECGFCNLIYKPLPVLRGETDEVWDAVSDIYEELVEKRTFSEESFRSIPVSCANHMEVFPERLPISELSENMICWVPVELLFNYDMDGVYGRQHMAAFYPLVNLYEYLLGMRNTYSWEEIKEDYYLYSADWVKRNNLEYTSDLKKSQIDSRVNVFLTMQKDAEINWNFFLENAPEAKLGESLHFYVSSSGRNRISFLVAKGYNYVPVKISKDDYEKWRNYEICEEVKKTFEQWGIRQLYAGVPHPVFREYAVRRTDYSRLFCMPVISEIVRRLHWNGVQYTEGYARVDNDAFHEAKEKYKVAVAVNDEGVLSRYLAMEKINSYRVLTARDMQIAQQIDKLMYLDENEYITDAEALSDVIQSSDVLVLEAGQADKSELFRGDLLFVLQDDGEFCGVLWEQKGYRLEKQIFSTVWEGNVVGGYMMIRMKGQE